MRSVIDILREKYSKQGKMDAVAVTAPTGIAACNIGGTEEPRCILSLVLALKSYRSSRPLPMLNEDPLLPSVGRIVQCSLSTRLVYWAELFVSQFVA